MSNNKKSFRDILAMMGIEQNPKTFGAKFFKTFQIVMIPLFIVLLATRPLIEEKREQQKREKEAKEESILAKKAKLRSEQFAKDFPEFQKKLDSDPNIRK